MSNSIKKIRQILSGRELNQLGVLLIAILVMAFVQMLGVASVLPFISLVLKPGIIFENHQLYWVYTALNFSSLNSYIIFIGFVMFIIIIFSNAMSALTTWLTLKFALMNNHRLSKRLLKKYLSMPYAYFLNQNSADLSNNVLNEINQLTYGYLLPLLTVIAKVLIAFFVLILLFWVEIWISLIAVFILGSTYAVLYYNITDKLKQIGTKRLEANHKRFKAVSEAFGGIKEIKVMNRESFFLNAYSEESFRIVKYSTWHELVSQMPRFALEAIAFGGIIIFVMFLLLTREDATQIVPLAGLFAFAGYRLMPAMHTIYGSLTGMKYNQSILERVHRDITEELKPEEINYYYQQNVVKTLPFRGKICLENVTYCYPGTTMPVISNIKLIIKYNTSVAFVGPTGAGKTTLADIILGLISPHEGLFTVDDIVVDETNVANWQANIGYVSQHIYLSDDTVARNIAFGVPENKIDRKAVESAARIANIEHFIVEEMPKGYDTLVGERGIRLSGGQRQRIGIARALYHNPAVLVFDEATSALDGATEDSVLKAIEGASRFKTLIIIAHRLTTVKGCDCIYIIDKGQITDSGTYNELLSSNEQFQKMSRLKI